MTSPEIPSLPKPDALAERRTALRARMVTKILDAVVIPPQLLAHPYRQYWDFKDEPLPTQQAPHGPAAVDK